MIFSLPSSFYNIIALSTSSTSFRTKSDNIITSFASTAKHNLENSKGEGKSIVYTSILGFLCSSFLLSQGACFYHFLSAWRSFVSHSFRGHLLETHSLSFPLFKNVLILLLFLKDIFIGYKILHFCVFFLFFQRL